MVEMECGKPHRRYAEARRSGGVLKRNSSMWLWSRLYSRVEQLRRSRVKE